MKLDKILKTLSEETITDLDGQDTSALQAVIARSAESISEATRERDENPHYQAAKQVTKDLSQGLNEVKTYQTAKIEYCLLKIREKSE